MHHCTTPKISQNIKYFFATSLKTLIFRDQISAPCGCICWPVPPCFQFPHLLLHPQQHLPPCAHLQHLLLRPHHQHRGLQHLLLHVLHHPANTCFDLPATIINICISTCALRSAPTPHHQHGTLEHQEHLQTRRHLRLQSRHLDYFLTKCKSFSEEPICIPMKAPIRATSIPRKKPTWHLCSK